MSYCRPSLRNLPETTAYKLETLKARLRSPESAQPPYRTIQLPTNVQTRPVFTAPRPSYADVLSPTLKPRAEWMKQDPPFLSDKEADRVWKESNELMFGHTSPTNLELHQQISNLQQLLDQRANLTPSSAPRQGTDIHETQQESYTSRVFRQGTRTNTTDKPSKANLDQSSSSNRTFSPKENAVEPKAKRSSTKKYENASQLKSSSKEIFSKVDDTGLKRSRDSRQLQNPSPDGEKEREDAQGESSVNSNVRPAKRKTSNEFGGATFWNRPANPKRKPPSHPDAFAATSALPQTHDLIVDTGASHVLFQHKHVDLLSNVKWSTPHKNPYATLRAANGQILTAIGKGIFHVKSISVVAYIFRDEDLVHNLLGIAPFADCGCEAVFTAHDFNLYHNKNLILSGKRHSQNLWHILLDRPDKRPTISRREHLATHIQPVLLLHEDTRRDRRYVQFVHACLGSPTPTTFLTAIQKGFLSGPNQFPRLTAKMVRKYMPNSEAMARGHLNKTPTSQPHALSQSVSAQMRYHHKVMSKAPAVKPQVKDDAKKVIKRNGTYDIILWNDYHGCCKPGEYDPELQAVVKIVDTRGTCPTELRPHTDAPITKVFDPKTVPKSTTIHMDYTGRLPVRCSSGTLYFLVACWGSYIHFEPLTTLRGADTATAMKAAIEFFRNQHVYLDTIRMDNQSSPEVRQLAIEMNLQWDIVNPYQKEPNRAERAIRTGKNHMIATRAGFHSDCPTTLLDRCMFQVELTLNLLHPFEYDPSISAHHGLFETRFDFSRHPIAPAGSKVLTWDSPDTRGSWADHGTKGIYLGPAMRHFRGFRIWVPLYSSTRISGTVWWFFKPFIPDEDFLSPDRNTILYPPTRDRPFPQPNGADLLGRCFFEPALGVCCITHLGPALTQNDEQDVPSVHYRCLATQAEHYSSVDRIVQWINDGPILQPPETAPVHLPAVTVTYPAYSPVLPGSSIHVPTHAPERETDLDTTQQTDTPTTITAITDGPTSIPAPSLDPARPLRRSTRKRKAPDFLKPKFKGKAYLTASKTHWTRKERVPQLWAYREKERVSKPQMKIRRVLRMKNVISPPTVEQLTFRRHRHQLRDLRDHRDGRFQQCIYHGTKSGHAMTSNKEIDLFHQNMPKMKFPPIYPRGPLNLNEDGTTITYRKSHHGPHAEQWAQADAEEFERLFKTGTLRPIFNHDIPQDKTATYLNPVCSEKIQDDGALKLRTRATLGGDRIDYPYTTTALTADLESIKILLNAMISDNAAFSTVDIEDFYLGTPLPHPEFVRIPRSLIPKRVIEFYQLHKFFHNGNIGVCGSQNPLWLTASWCFVSGKIICTSRATWILSTPTCSGPIP